MTASCRTLFALTLLLLASAPMPAAAGCPVPAYSSQSSIQIADWHERYIAPFLTYAGAGDSSRPTKEQAEAHAAATEEINHRMLGDSLHFEPFVQQIAAYYARQPDFKGLNSSTAQKIYRPGPSLDFAWLCIDTRSVSTPDDTFGITLFGVSVRDCRTGLRGLVFTDTLINGVVEGQCRPDDLYFKHYILPLNAGTNTITFLCRNDMNGCLRQ